MHLSVTLPFLPSHKWVLCSDSQVTIQGLGGLDAKEGKAAVRLPLPKTVTSFSVQSISVRGRIGSSERRIPVSSKSRIMALSRLAEKSLPSLALSSRRSNSSPSSAGGSSGMYVERQLDVP